MRIIILKIPIARLFLVFSFSIFLIGSCSPTAIPNLTPTQTPLPATSTVVPTLAPGQARIVGYFTSWGVGMRGYTVAQIPGDRLTHLNYAFGNISPAGPRCALGDPTADVNRFYGARDAVDKKADLKDGMHGNFNQLLKLKEKYPHLKVLISIGGWTWSPRFSGVALTTETRQEFAQSCVSLFFKKYPGVFDGVDIDWEYPVSGGLEPGRPEDKHNFTLLLSEFRKALDEQGKTDSKQYLLTIAAPAGPSTIANLEIDQIYPILDWINVMTYDFHVGGEKTTNFQSPLYGSSGDPSSDPVIRLSFNADAAIQAYLKAGVPSTKLVMGIPFYARGWQGVPNQNNGLFQPATGPAKGVWEPGVFDYSELKRNYLPTYQRFWSDEAKVPWLYSPEKGIMITYEDPESVQIKADYTIAHGLGGVMFWELSNDGGELLQAIAKELGK